MAVIASHPLDTVKCRIQASSRYTGVVQCVRLLVREEGALALYRGLPSPGACEGAVRDRMDCVGVPPA